MARNLSIPLGTMELLLDIPPDRPVLIAGPTASGKSRLALQIASSAGGRIINADALQVFANWRILTARPTPKDEARAPHALYGHVAGHAEYSAGQWLRDLTPLLQKGARPIIVGGTGLYFSALTNGLVDIPATPAKIRAEADRVFRQDGLPALLAGLDPTTSARIDRQNPMRVQRAWEVLKSTGRGLADWQDQTPPPLLPLNECTALLLEADTDWLNARISRRFDQMLAQGALDEVCDNAEKWDPNRQSAKAIGAAELISFIKGEISCDEARETATISTRQYAKRQRSWFRSKMRGWNMIKAGNI
ncbi:tRNA dimethylallyltransferase [hydrothermal vent metagenome]|uniref:tRNA dimethylallyltransferase n=1 Tax=hydrothermal vent metagenome TaxID=652676 RepID=A0A3B0RQ93_9ZZZZ